MKNYSNYAKEYGAIQLQYYESYKYSEVEWFQPCILIIIVERKQQNISALK